MIGLASDCQGSEVFSGTSISALFLVMGGRSGRALRNRLCRIRAEIPVTGCPWATSSQVSGLLGRSGVDVYKTAALPAELHRRKTPEHGSRPPADPRRHPGMRRPHAHRAVSPLLRPPAPAAAALRAPPGHQRGGQVLELADVGRGRVGHRDPRSARTGRPARRRRRYSSPGAGMSAIEANVNSSGLSAYRRRKTCRPSRSRMTVMPGSAG